MDVGEFTVGLHASCCKEWVNGCGLIAVLDGGTPVRCCIAERFGSTGPLEAESSGLISIVHDWDQRVWKPESPVQKPGLNTSDLVCSPELA